MLEDLLRWHSYNINNQLKLLSFLGAWEQRESSVKLDHDATEAPHIDLLRIGEQPEDDIRGTIEPTLDVSVNDLVLQAPTSKVCHNNTTLVLALEQDIFWLEVAMDDAKILHVPQR